MVAMRSPMPVIPGVSRARVTVRIRLGIRVVRPLIVPVWIIIVAPRIGITVPRKSKTESPNPWKSRGDLSVSTLPGNEGQSADCQSNQEKLLHRFTSSICFGFCLLFCEEGLRVFLYRGIRMRSASRLPRRIQNGVGSCNSGFQPDRSSRLPSLPIHDQAGCRFDETGKMPVLRATPHKKFVHEIQAILRHSEIGENLARKICRKLSIPDQRQGGPNPFDALSFGDDNARPC
jgi:hypothetical protein